MRKTLWTIAILLLVLCIAGVGATWWVAEQLTDPAIARTGVADTVTVIIRRGEGMQQVARRLDSLGLLRSARVFRYASRYMEIDQSLHPGRYDFNTHQSALEILDALKHHRFARLTVTIPEGWTTDRIAERMAAVFEFPVDSFLAYTTDITTLSNLDVPIDRLEGYLFPATYTFPWGAGPRAIVDEMAESQRSHFAVDSIGGRLRELDMTVHELLTLASLVEAETGVSDERARIAAVFHNRLSKRMKLQCDPTVLYAMGGLPEGVTTFWTKYLEYESPYNTYLYYGLPPGPICHPGRKAILAALYPLATDELYFVADGNGGHVFSRTLREHNRARERVKRGNG